MFLACVEPPPVDAAWIDGAATPDPDGEPGGETLTWLAEGTVVCAWSIPLTARFDLPPCTDADDRPCTAAFAGTRGETTADDACDETPPRVGAEVVGVGWIDDYRIAGQSNGARGLWWDGEAWSVAADGIGWDGATLSWRFPTSLPETGP